MKKAKLYVEVSSAEKLELLQSQSPGWENLEGKQWCFHCEKQFTGESVRVYKEGDLSLLCVECGTPGCNGSPLHWSLYPWWDEKHPETVARDKEKVERWMLGALPSGHQLRPPGAKGS